jgi:hypothetical protein
MLSASCRFPRFRRRHHAAPDREPATVPVASSTEKSNENNDLYPVGIQLQGRSRVVDMEETETVIPKWRRVADSTLVGLVVGIGIGVLATVLAAMMHDARPLLIVVWVCATVGVWEISRIIFRAEHVRGATFFGGLVLACLVLLLYAELAPVDFQNNESLPGFAGYTVIRIEEEAEARRKVYFSASDPEGAMVVFYQSKSDMFRLIVVDANGESEALNVPSGHNGIPLNQWVVLTYDVGVAADHSFMRVALNGHSVSERNFPFHLELGSRNWTALNIGASPRGNDSVKFQTTEDGEFSMTLTHDVAAKIVANARKRNGF